MTSARFNHIRLLSQSHASKQEYKSALYELVVAFDELSSVNRRLERNRDFFRKLATARSTALERIKEGK